MPVPRTPRVRDMNHHRSCSGQCLDCHQVEAILIARPPETQRPQTGSTRNVSLLALGDHLEPAAADAAPARLDLDEGNRVLSSNDEVHIMPAQFEAMCLDAPPTRAQIRERNTLPTEAQELTTVFPLCCRNKPADCIHGPT